MIMASSSIEVMGMGGEDMKVMLLDDGPQDEEMAKKMQELIHCHGPLGHIIDTGPPLSEQPTVPPGQEEEYQSLSQFSSVSGMVPPPGTIIFSPQDMMRSKPPVRGRGRGRGTTIKAESGVKQQQDQQQQELEVPVACDICHKVMMTGKTLVQHMAIHSDMKPFQCPHCPKSFARKVHLQGHLVIHGIEKQFECPVCHQRFSRQDCVKVHMRLHDKSKCVYCDVCHKAFLTVGALNIHLRIHRGEKPFKCHLCSKCFTQKNHLITHIKRHTKVADEHFTKKLGPRMFKCEHCTRAFIRLSDYERHVQWNHGAVAEGSIVDKLPTVSNILDGEMKQTGLAPQIFKAPKDAINNKQTKGRRGKKVMCVASTQTDEGGGHVIIPRIYQSQVSTSTQVSAPPTPRPADDDMYENDIFDEGMDRNYSSDEDEDDPEAMESSPNEKKVFAVTGTSDMASDPVQDAAFDAIVQGSSVKPTSNAIEEEAKVQGAMRVVEEEEPPTITEVTESSVSHDEHAVFLQEVVSSLNKQGLDVRESEPEKENNNIPDEENMEITESGPKETASNPLSDSPVKMVKSIEEQFEDDFEGATMVNDVVPLVDDRAGFHFAVPRLVLTKGRPKTRGRGRGRVARIKKYFHGLSGAAELRYIRKSMMMSIMNATAEERDQNNESPKDFPKPEETKPASGTSGEEAKPVSGSPDDVEVEGRVKRMAKKQHGKDFVCNMKNCETCMPSQKQNVKVQPKTSVKLKEKDLENMESVSTKKSLNALNATEVQLGSPSPSQTGKSSSFIDSKSPKPIVKRLVKSTDKPWVTSGSQIDVKKLKESVKSSEEKSKLEMKKPVPVPDDVKMKVANHVGTYPVDITAHPLSNKARGKEDFFVTTTKTESIVSPPVELMSFCIPTYSCKLCGREFRFEGKLHRHIESVHQNKAIFSADVKPGRGSHRYSTVCRMEKVEEVPTMAPPTREIEPENPEIAALRSEWDDDDDDDGDEEEEMKVSSVSGAATTIPSAVTYTPAQQAITIVTREITPMTTTVTGSMYSSGVKVNMNKLSGLLPQVRELHVTNTSQIKENTTSRVSASVAPSTHHPRDSETIMADTLDMKCRRLLEKLFDHNLLMNCGLVEEHVSVVLGRVLQHYGVKMIEDYGQGQYEVLKYNLWRLIEWKVTMEQMEEFYTAGKSVEEMMDDIMNERVPLVSHHFVPNEQKANPPPQVSQPASQVTQVETVEVADSQMVLQQVAGVLGGQLNLPEGVTQVVLAQDVSPDLLQGAHIVTIDPTTGQVISQVTADQVILTDAIGDELEQQVAALDGQVVVSQAHMANQAVTQESIVVPHTSAIAMHANQSQVSHGQMIVHAAPPAAPVPQQQPMKVDTQNHATQQQHQHHPHQQ